MRSALLITKGERLALYMKTNAIAICERLGMDGNNLRKRRKPRSLQCFPQDVQFHPNLLRIGGVLILASTTQAEILAGRICSLDGGLKYGIQIRVGEAALVFDYVRFYHFARQREGNKDRFAVGARQSRATVYRSEER